MNTLKSRRERADLTQEGLAKLAKVPQATISRVERGTTPGVDIALRLASALGATVEEVFTEVVEVEHASAAEPPKRPSGTFAQVSADALPTATAIYDSAKATG